MRTSWRALGALLVLVLVSAVPAHADGSHPTFVDGELQPTGGHPYDRDRPAVNVSPTPQRAGRIVFPVAGPASWTNTFGDCRGSGCSRPHLGVDLMAAKGTPVVAADAGRIAWVSSTCCSLAIRHDDGWTSYYVHLNNDSPGTDDGLGAGIVAGLGIGSRVSAGQHIGWMGDSGNAEWTASHLHFEMQDPTGVWHDPTPFVDTAKAAPSGLPGPPAGSVSSTTPPTTSSTTTTTTTSPTTTTPSTTAVAPTTMAPPSTTPPSTTDVPTPEPGPSTTATPPSADRSTVSTIVLEVGEDGSLAVTDAEPGLDVPGRVDEPFVAHIGPEPTADRWVAPPTIAASPPETGDPVPATTEATAVVEPEPVSVEPPDPSVLGEVQPPRWRTVTFDVVATVGDWLGRLGA